MSVSLEVMRAAHRAVAAALRKGILVRPDHCSSCEHECRPEAHHPDYSQPLAVVWLCSECHLRAHGKAPCQPRVAVAATRSIPRNPYWAPDATMMPLTHAAFVMGMSYGGTHKALLAGRLQGKKHGPHWFVTRESVEAMLKAAS